MNASRGAIKPSKKWEISSDVPQFSKLNFETLSVSENTTEKEVVKAVYCFREPHTSFQKTKKQTNKTKRQKAHLHLLKLFGDASGGGGGGVRRYGRSYFRRQLNH